jgi:hypothetical protein
MTWRSGAYGCWCRGALGGQRPPSITDPNAMASAPLLWLWCGANVDRVRFGCYLRPLMVGAGGRGQETTQRPWSNMLLGENNA